MVPCEQVQREEHWIKPLPQLHIYTAGALLSQTWAGEKAYFSPTIDPLQLVFRGIQASLHIRGEKVSASTWIHEIMNSSEPYTNPPPILLMTHLSSFANALQKEDISSFWKREVDRK